MGFIQKLFGESDGLHTEYYDSGEKSHQGNYKDGLKNAFWHSWYENGQKLLVVKKMAIGLNDTEMVRKKSSVFIPKTTYMAR